MIQILNLFIYLFTYLFIYLFIYFSAIVILILIERYEFISNHLFAAEYHPHEITPLVHFTLLFAPVELVMF